MQPRRGTHPSAMAAAPAVAARAIAAPLERRLAGRPARSWTEGVTAAGVTRAWLVVPLLGAVASRAWSIALLWAASRERDQPLFGPYGLTAGWDAKWYLGIAANGYHRAPLQVTSLGGHHDYAFFPLWPLVIRGASILHLPPADAAVVISPALFCVAAVLIAAVLEPVFGRLAATDATLLLAFSPGAWTFSMGYSEGLFLVVAAAGCLASRPGRKATACGLAALTRIAGLPLVAANVVRLVESRGRDAAALLAAAVGAAGFVAWWLVVAAISGDPLGFFRGSPDWGPVTGIWDVAKVVTGPEPQLVGQLALIAALVVGAGVAFKRDRGLGTYALLALGLGFLPGGLVSSMPRYALTAFPSFGGLASLSGRRLTAMLIVAFAIAQAVLVAWSFPAHGHGLAP